MRKRERPPCNLAVAGIGIFLDMRCAGKIVLMGKMRIVVLMGLSDRRHSHLDFYPDRIDTWTAQSFKMMASMFSVGVRRAG